MLDETLAHVGERKQFGQRLADFQVIQHRLADMYMSRALAMALVRRNLIDRPATPERRAYQASATLLVAGRAVRDVGEGAVQLHGAMGVTEELATGHYFRRATVLQHQLGSWDWHAGRCGEYLRETTQGGG